MIEKTPGTILSSPRMVTLLASAAALALLAGQQALAQPTGTAPRPAPSTGPGAPPRMPEVAPPARAPVQSAAAPTTLTAFILRGRAVRGSGAADANTPTRLSPGMRVASPPGTWTEIAFSDGSSIVIQAGGDFTLHGMGQENGRLVIRGASSRGSLRASTSDGVELLVAIGGIEVRIVSGSAVVEAGPGGSVTMLSGRRVTVRRNGGDEEVIRRPGFAVALASGGPERRTRGQVAAILAPFAPVQAPEDAPTAMPEVPRLTNLAGNPAEPGDAAQPTQRQRSETTLAVTEGRSRAGSATAATGGFSAGAGRYVELAGSPLTLAAPGLSVVASRSVTTTAWFADTNADPNVGVAGIHSNVVLGSGRLRRWAREGVVGTAGEPRSDSAALLQGDPRNPLGTFSSNGTLGSATDAIVTVGMVTLNTLPPGSLGGAFVRQPRLTIGAPGTPNAIAATSDQQPLAMAFIGPIVASSGERQSIEIRYNSTYRIRGRNGRPDSVVHTFGNPSSNQIEANIRNGLHRAGYYEPDVYNPLSDTSLVEISLSNIITTSSMAYNPASIAERNLQAISFPINIMVRNDEGNDVLVAHVLIDGRLQPIGDVGRTVPIRTTVSNDGIVNLLPDGRTNFVYVDSASVPDGGYATLGPFLAITRMNTDAPAEARAPRVFIIDTVTDSSERYFVIGGTPVAPAPNGMPGSQRQGAVTRFAVSDGLNPTGGLVAGRTVESQFVAPGAQAQPALFNRYNAFRPEGTFVAGAPRADTHLMVASGNSGTPNVAMRVDMDFATGGDRSASVSVGGIGTFEPLDRSGVSLVLSGNTVGTARLQGGPVAVGGRIGSLGTDATGRHAHMFYGAESGEQVGHFAVGQQDVRRGSPGSDGGQPGTVEILGGTSSPFGFTRLSTNVSARTGAERPAEVLPQGGAVNYLGFATAMVETPQGGTMNLHSVSAPGYGMALVRNDGSNEFAAVIDLAPRAPGHMALNPFAAAPTNGASGTQRMEFGARDAQTGQPTTAWIGAGTFAGVRPGTTAPDGSTRADGAALFSVDATLQPVVPSAPGYQMPTSDTHLAWGYFLGDLANVSGGARRDHVNLGFWVAGRPVDFATLSTLRGTFTYTGGMIGTVAQNGGVRVAAGGFNHTWDFGSRTGRLAATFDGRDYNARVAMLGTNPIFTGSGLDAQRDRRMVVQGGFFGTLAPGTPPPAVGGAFGIAGSGYAANGIFNGRQVP